MTTAQDRLNQILPSWYDLLTQWSLDGSLVAAATDALMLDSSNAKQDAKGQLQSYVSQWSAGNFQNLPKIVLLSAEGISGARGAYADSTDTIYLNQEWLLTASEEDIQKVLTEELGHYLDDQLNTKDTQGDEGRYFSEYLTEGTPDQPQIQKLRTENDYLRVSLQGYTVDTQASSAPAVRELLVNGSFEQNRDKWPTTETGISNDIDDGMYSFNPYYWAYFIDTGTWDNVPGWYTGRDLNGNLGTIDLLLNPERVSRFDGSTYIELDGGYPEWTTEFSGIPNVPANNSHGYLKQDLTDPVKGDISLSFAFCACPADPSGSNFALFVNDKIELVFTKADDSSSWAITNLSGGTISAQYADAFPEDGPTSGWQQFSGNISPSFGFVSSIGFQGGAWNGATFDPLQQNNCVGAFVDKVSLSVSNSSRATFRINGNGTGVETQNLTCTIDREDQDGMTRFPASSNNGYTYQWQISSDGMSWSNATGTGATTFKYSVNTTSDANKFLRVQVGYTDDKGFNETVYTEQVKIISGTTKSDKFAGTAGVEVTFSDSGADAVATGAGNDFAKGGIGNDTFTGADGDGDDFFDGQTEIDIINYSASSKGVDIDFVTGLATERTVGGIGKDSFAGIENARGTTGADSFKGSTSVNVFTGSGGADTFIFANAQTFGASTSDRITDMSSDDKIQVSASAFSIVGKPYSFAAVSGTKAVNASAALIVYDTGSGYLYLNKDGATSGMGGGGIFAVLDNKFVGLAAGNVSLI